MSENTSKGFIQPDAIVLLIVAVFLDGLTIISFIISLFYSLGALDFIGYIIKGIGIVVFGLNAMIDNQIAGAKTNNDEQEGEGEGEGEGEEEGESQQEASEQDQIEKTGEKEKEDISIKKESAEKERQEEMEQTNIKEVAEKPQPIDQHSPKTEKEEQKIPTKSPPNNIPGQKSSNDSKTTGKTGAGKTAASAAKKLAQGDVKEAGKLLTKATIGSLIPYSQVFPWWTWYAIKMYWSNT